MHPTSSPRRAPPLGRDRVQGRGQDEAAPLPRPQPSYNHTQACPAVLPAWGPPNPWGESKPQCECSESGKAVHVETGLPLPWGHAVGDKECSPPPSPPPPKQTRPSPPPPRTRPSPPPMPPVSPPCPTLLDFVLVLDESGSMGPVMNGLKAFAKLLVRHYHISRPPAMSLRLFATLGHLAQPDPEPPSPSQSPQARARARTQAALPTLNHR